MILLWPLSCCINWSKTFRYHLHIGVADREDRANLFASHAGDITHRFDGDRVKLRNKSRWLGAHRHASTAVDAGVPTNVKEDGGVLHEQFSVFNDQFSVPFDSTIGCPNWGKT